MSRASRGLKTPPFFLSENGTHLNSFFFLKMCFLQKKKVQYIKSLLEKKCNIINILKHKIVELLTF